MLKDENKVVRSLTWYVTLPLLLGKIIDLDEVLQYLPYLCELLNSNFHDMVVEVLEEFKLRCEKHLKWEDYSISVHELFKELGMKKKRKR